MFVRFFMLPTIIRICSGNNLWNENLHFFHFAEFFWLEKVLFPIQRNKIPFISQALETLLLYQKKKKKRKLVGNKWKSEILYIMFNFRFVNLVAKYKRNQINGKSAAVAGKKTEGKMINTRNHWDVSDRFYHFQRDKSYLFSQWKDGESYSST